jgi:hypothetical protein
MGDRTVTIGRDASGSVIVTGEHNVVYVLPGVAELSAELIEKLQSGALRPQQLPEAVPYPTLNLRLEFVDDARCDWAIVSSRPGHKDEPIERIEPTPWSRNQWFATALDRFWQLSRRAVEKGRRDSRARRAGASAWRGSRRSVKR